MGGENSRTDGRRQTLSSRLFAFENAVKTAKLAGRVEDSTRVRIAMVFMAFAAVFTALAIGAAETALFSGGKRSVSSGVQAIARADLTDRNGAVLAVNLVHYSLFVDPHEIWDKDEIRRALTGHVPGLVQSRLERALAGKRRMQVLSGLTPEQRFRLWDLGLPGVSFEPEEGRVYPRGTFAAHLIGFTDTGGVGLAGVEKALDQRIRTDGQDGRPIALSLDIRIQAALEDELKVAVDSFRPKGAVGLVVRVRTGEVLGMASLPDFDPNFPGAASDDQRLNRAAAQVYEMGSTFKTFTVAAGLDTGVANLASTFDARQPLQIGYRQITDYHAKADILTLTEVFTHSSNIGTAQLALRIRPERLSYYFDLFGLTHSAKIELRESARPLTPKVWDEDALASTSFGHGMLVSPIALAEAYCAILNGGTRRPLTILKQATVSSGQRVISEQTSKTMLTIMRANVAHAPDGKAVGTGGKADAPGLRVGGKTGTGEKVVNGHYDHGGLAPQVSSFAAVFPTDGPLDSERYFVLILLDEPHATAETSGYSTGGWVAAPAAGRVINRIAPFLGVLRTPSRSSGLPLAGRVVATNAATEAGL